MNGKVHPQIRALIDQANEMGIPKLQSLDTKAGRALAENMARVRLEDYPAPEVFEVENTSTGPGYGHVPVRIYRTSNDSRAPVIVYYHGGGHVICSLDTHDTLTRYLAKVAGCTVVSVDYRMGPEYPFPAAVDDCFDATRWVSDNAEMLRVDPGRLAVCGDSAGGNLAAVMAILARDSGLPVSAQVLIYPVIDYRGGTPSYAQFGTGFGGLEADTMTWFLDRYLPDPALRDDWHACLDNAALDARLPPALVLTAECDVLHDEGVAYAGKLQAAGAAVQHVEFPGMIHGFFGFLGLVDDTARAHDIVGTYLRGIWP